MSPRHQYPMGFAYGEHVPQRTPHKFIRGIGDTKLLQYLPQHRTGGALQQHLPPSRSPPPSGKGGGEPRKRERGIGLPIPRTMSITTNPAPLARRPWFISRERAVWRGARPIRPPALNGTLIPPLWVEAIEKGLVCKIAMEVFDEKV